MPYIGTSPSQGVRRVHTYTATADQRTFTGAGDEGATLSYKDSNFVDVYQNGVKLGDADYVATSGTSIVLDTGATVSDLVVIVAYDVFSAADTVSKADGGTFDGNVTMAGTLGVTGAITGTLATAAQTNVTSVGTLTSFRSTGIDDNADAVAITIDSSENVGISETSPLAKLHVKTADSGGSVNASADELVIEGSANSGITLLSGASNNGNIFFGDSGDDNAGRIAYAHSNNSFTFTTNGSNALTIDSSGNATFNGTVLASNGTNSLPSLSFSGDTNTGLYRPAADNLGFAVGGVARAFMSGTQFAMTGNGRFSGTIIAESGDITISDGNLVVASGHGIDFGAGANASGMSSELLDDYEEGTFTPALDQYGGTATISAGNYTKIGRMVYCTFEIIINNFSDGSHFIITSLPFTAINTATMGGYVNYTDSTKTGRIHVLKLNGDQRAALYEVGGGSLTYNELRNGASTVQVRLTVIYHSA